MICPAVCNRPFVIFRQKNVYISYSIWLLVASLGLRPYFFKEATISTPAPYMINPGRLFRAHLIDGTIFAYNCHMRLL